MPRNPIPMVLQRVFDLSDGVASQSDVRTAMFVRSNRELAGRARFAVDQFSDAGGASCAFLRVGPNAAGIARFVLEGPYGMEACPSGGWLLMPEEPAHPIYWLPCAPVLRAIDPNGRILREEATRLNAFKPASTETTIDIQMRGPLDLDCAIWRLGSEAAEIIDNLLQPSTLEQQPIFMLSSHTSLRRLGEIYDYLIHGHVYERRFDQMRNRMICSELEAYSIYLALHGLQAATGKALHRLLKRQILFSVIARQAEDGGWRHGEWTDFMESHYRFHNAAMLLLEAALEETPGDAITDSLKKAADVLSRASDRTDIGLWFFHDSLEQSVEVAKRSGQRLVLSRELGKSPATKMIVNSHLDAIVTLDRYRELTGDGRYSEHVRSALGATRTLLGLRPADWLYRPLYWAIGLTLLPEADARRLPFVLRAIKRVTRDYLTPRLHRIKRRFPRIVMPGGLIERHLSRLHFGVNYHSVNLMDLARLWRRFPSEDFAGVVEGAVAAVTATRLLQYWVESKQRQALGYWVEALYQLCTLRREAAYRRYLAEAIIAALDAELGLPPSLLGAHPEVVRARERFPCPSPSDPRLRVANLSCHERREILVVNPTAEAIELAWETGYDERLAWRSADGRPLGVGTAPAIVAPRGWLLGSEA